MRLHDQAPLLAPVPQPLPGLDYGTVSAPTLPISDAPAPVTRVTRLGKALRRAEARALADQAGVLAYGAGAAIYTRQFFTEWVLSGERAIAGIVLRNTVGVASATLGTVVARRLMKQTASGSTTAALERGPAPGEGSEDRRRRVNWARGIAAGLAVGRLLACPLGEAPAMALNGLLHVALQLVPLEGGSAQIVLDWSVYAAYLGVRELAFSELGPWHRHLVSMEALPPAATSCNGHEEICAKRWCDVVFPATHNAACMAAPFTRLPWPLNQIGRYASNQGRTLEQQFADGIRGHLLEYYLASNGQLMSSHNTIWNIEPLVQTFTRLRDTVAANPRDLLVLKFSPQGVHKEHPWELAPQVEQALTDSGLKAYMQSPTRPDWLPTLHWGGMPCDLTAGQLLDAGVQVIAFDYGFRESSYSASHVSEITCHDLLPWYNGPNPVPITFNAFTSYAFQPASDVVNQHLTRVYNECAALLGAAPFLPTLLAVNSYETSVVVPLARALNTNGTLPDSYAAARGHGVRGLASDGVVLGAVMCVLGVSLLVSLLKRRDR